MQVYRGQPASVCADIQPFTLIVYPQSFHIVGFGDIVMSGRYRPVAELSGRGIPAVHASGVRPYPHIPSGIFGKAVDHIVVQRVGVCLMTQGLEMVPERMPVVYSLVICAEPHSSLIVPADAPY